MPTRKALTGKRLAIGKTVARPTIRTQSSRAGLELEKNSRVVIPNRHGGIGTVGRQFIGPKFDDRQLRSTHILVNQ